MSLECRNEECSLLMACGLCGEKTLKYCEKRLDPDAEFAAFKPSIQSAGSVCTVAVPFQALNMAQLLLTHKAKGTQNADLLRMVAELKKFEEALLYSESKPNATSDFPGN